MTDYIDRQAAIDAVMALMPSLTTADGSGQFDAEIYRVQELFVDIGQVLNDLPSAEAEPVTRCKDCIYYRQEIDMCDEPYSTAHNVVHEDDYCSRAERKEKE